MYFIVLALKFRSSIHFELIFEYGIRQGSNFIFLYVDIQFPRAVCEENFLFLLNALGTLVKTQLTLYAWAYFWALNSISLVYMCIHIPVPHCFDDCNFSKF